MIGYLVTFPVRYYTHKLVPGSELLFKECAGTLIVRKKTDGTTILGQNDEHISFGGFTMQLFADHGKDTGMFTTHIREVTDVIKTVQTGYVQHRASSFSTSRRKPW